MMKHAIEPAFNPDDPKRDKPVCAGCGGRIGQTPTGNGWTHLPVHPMLRNRYARYASVTLVDGRTGHIVGFNPDDHFLIQLDGPGGAAGRPTISVPRVAIR